MKSRTIFPLNTSEDLAMMPATKHVIELLVTGFNERMKRIRPTTSVSIRDIMRAAGKMGGMEVEWDSGLYAIVEQKPDATDTLGIGAMLMMAFGGSNATAFEFYISPESRDNAKELLEAEAEHLRELLADAMNSAPKLAKSKKKNAKALIAENEATIINLRAMLDTFSDRLPDFDALKVEVEWTVEFMPGYLRFAPILSGQYLDKAAGDIDFLSFLSVLGIYGFSLPIFGLVSCENHPTTKWCLSHEKLDLMREIAPAVALDAGQFLVSVSDMRELLKPIGVDVSMITNVGIAARMLTQLDGLNNRK